MTKRFILTTLCALTLLTCASSVEAGRRVRIQACLDGDACSASSGISSGGPHTEATCSVDISGCHGQGGCAFCACDIFGCGCNCRGGSASKVLGLMSALELDQPFPFVSHDLTLGGFVGLMSGSNLAGWTIATTFEAGSEESVTQLSLGEGIATGQGLTLRQILQEFAVASGARLEISEKTRVIAFLNPAK